MSYFISPEFARVLLLGCMTGLHMTWRQLVATHVPDPYLDEVFHVPQVQAYWEGRWKQWDPKITTPPGLYVFSYAVSAIQTGFDPDVEVTTETWRFVNIVLLYLLLVALYTWTTVARKPVEQDNVLQREFSIVMFPLLFFFSGLYYTDVFSVFTVVITHIFWSAGIHEGGLRLLFQALHLLAGLVSLATRQTNIFWVGVYLGGLQVVDTIKGRVGANKVHDPPFGDAYFEDFPTAIISIVQSSLSVWPRLVLDLWPQLTLLLSFAAFMFWNGGVVLGDKDNHVATIHFAQMLYIWPLIVFFSWPVLLPQLAHLQSFRRRLPRPAALITALLLMLTVVHTNTIVHPFTLADNRHYTFYVFRLLLRHWTFKYAATPVYLACAWLVLGALAGAPAPPKSKELRILYGADTVCVSWVLVWLISTTLSLVTAPLVEPRYFIVPWLMWRLAVPDLPSGSVSLDSTAPAAPSGDAKAKDKKTKQPAPSPSLLAWVVNAAAANAAYLEFGWYVAVNVAIGYMFLYRGFSWPQEPGNVQRFMW